MSDYDLKIFDKPTKEVTELVSKPLKQYNDSQVGEYSRHEFAICAFDKKNIFIGGMYGWLCWGWLYIEWAFIDERWRHAGVGSRLLARCEQSAKDNGIYNSRLNTGSFQAPEFYLQRIPNGLKRILRRMF